MKTKVTILKATVLILVIVLMVIHAGNAQGSTNRGNQPNQSDQSDQTSQISDQSARSTRGDQSGKSLYQGDPIVYFDHEGGVVDLSRTTPPSSCTSTLAFTLLRSYKYLLLL